jgi:hypothetical protein
VAGVRSSRATGGEASRRGLLGTRRRRHQAHLTEISPRGTGGEPDAGLSAADGGGLLNPTFERIEPTCVVASRAAGCSERRSAPTFRRGSEGDSGPGLTHADGDPGPGCFYGCQAPEAEASRSLNRLRDRSRFKQRLIARGVLPSAFRLAVSGPGLRAIGEPGRHNRLRTSLRCRLAVPRSWSPRRIS